MTPDQENRIQDQLAELRIRVNVLGAQIQEIAIQQRVHILMQREIASKPGMPEDEIAEREFEVLKSVSLWWHERRANIEATARASDQNISARDHAKPSSLN